MPLLSAKLLTRLSNLTLRSRRRAAGVRVGSRKSQRRGQSQEFADHRPYVAGDDLRFLDWHLYGRLDTLWVKLFEEQEDRTVQVLIDSSASMEGEKLEYARKVAAALGFVALTGTDRVTVAALSDKLDAYSPPRRGRSQAPALFSTLEAIQPGGVTDLTKALAGYPRQRGAGIGLLFTDFMYDEDPDTVLRRLVARGMELHVFQILSPVDIRPAVEGDLTLIDAETGEEMIVTVDDDVLDRFEKSVRAWCEVVAQSCSRLGVGYSRVVTNMPVEDFVMRELRETGLVT
ncbi:MAG: DUF58 domain-containing protein [Proteobacteria bacterium]|nr:DUF58 domain-containing protein [Pseudomonadota bacterium]